MSENKPIVLNTPVKTKEVVEVEKKEIELSEREAENRAELEAYKANGVVDNEKPFGDNEKVPSNWEIKPVGNGEISARNILTHRVFFGTVADFNKKRKGK